jgi:hypothetical protein
MFKEPTPEGVFQTVDVGAGRSEYILRQVKRFPDRNYAVVDPVYAEFTEHDGSPTSKLLTELKNRNVTVSKQRLERFLQTMKDNGLTARHFNFDMPENNDARSTSIIEQYSLKNFFSLLPGVLAPNGRISFTSESGRGLHEVRNLAIAHGLIAGPVRMLRFKHDVRIKIPGEPKPALTGKKHTPTMQHVRDIFPPEKLKQLQLTYVASRHKVPE